MLTINPTIYEQFASTLTEQIGSNSFYSDQITLETYEVDYALASTLIIAFDQCHYPEGSYTEISQIYPVWWELKSITDQGEELNDFDFNILKELICNQ